MPSHASGIAEKLNDVWHAGRLFLFPHSFLPQTGWSG